MSLILKYKSMEKFPEPEPRLYGVDDGYWATSKASEPVVEETPVEAPVVQEVVQVGKHSLTPLPGHTSPETAYLVNDYPYSWKLRCKIRYWLEYKVNQGFRLVSQTTNPKVAGEHWNKPKASTYRMLAVMGLNAENHVTWQGLSHYEFSELEAFEAAYGSSFNNVQRGVYVAARVAMERYERQKAKAAAALQSIAGS